jgi:hypothetical protein
MRAVADPSAPESVIAKNAYDRLDQMSVDHGLGPNAVEIARQAAEILLMMRPADEPPSDFQEYTLVAVLAAACHLAQHPLGERFGLPALARRYGQDAESLEQVFEYIMGCLGSYRQMYQRMQALAAEGALDDDEGGGGGRGIGDGGRRHAAGGGVVAAMADLDGFGAKLNAILQADLTAAAMAAGPLDPGPSFVGPLLAAVAPEGGPLPAEVDQAHRNLRALQEQVALLDRIQNIRQVFLFVGGATFVIWCFCAF